MFKLKDKFGISTIKNEYVLKQLNQFRDSLRLNDLISLQVSPSGNLNPILVKVIKNAYPLEIILQKNRKTIKMVVNLFKIQYWEKNSHN